MKEEDFNMNILILGAGRIGSAIAKTIQPNVRAVEFWDVAEGKVANQKPIAELAAWADIIFFCIPSGALKDAIAALNKKFKPTAIFIALSKGLQKDTGKTVNQLLEEFLPKGQPHGLMIGPMLAAEIEKGQPTAGLIAIKEKRDFDTVQSLFKGTCIYTEHASEVYSVALASVIKNIYAVGFGVCQAMGVGHNGQGWYAAIAMREMKRIIEQLGGNGEIAHGLAGIGDLVATGMSPHSHNRITGEKIITTGVCGKSEGCNSLPAIWDLLKKPEEFKLLSTLQAIIVERKDARTEMGVFFRTP